MKEKAGKSKNDENKSYELAYLLSPLVAAESLEEQVEQEIKRLLAKARATLKSEVKATLRPLAYPIKKVVEHKGSTFREAYFGSIIFEAEPELLTALESGIKQSSLVIRHLLVTLPARAFLTPPPARPRPSDAPTGGQMSTAAMDQEIDQLLTTEAK